MNDTLSTFAQEKIKALDAHSLMRTLKPTHRVDGVWVERAGRRLVSFSCNDYLGLSHHPAVKAAAKQATDLYGTGSGASRLITGDHPLFAELEARLACLKGTEAACVFGSGYLANTGTIPTFISSGDLVLVDELAHACIWAGANLSGARSRPLPITIWMTWPPASQTPGRGRSGVGGADGVFSMDGDIAPLGEISRLCQAGDTWLLVDDAHGLGVLGGGVGTAALFPDARVDLAVGTLSKAVGGYGAYVCATKPIIDFVKTRARTLVYSTGLPPANTAAAIAALDIIGSEPELVAAPLTHARRFTSTLNLPQAQSAAVPILLGDAQTALAAAAELEDKGFPGRAHPTAHGASRYRPPTDRLHRRPHTRAGGPAGRRRQAMGASMSAPAVFIAGAHTDVGKTYVACALIRAARARGLSTDALKPVASDINPDDWRQSDPGRLLAALGRDLTPRNPGGYGTLAVFRPSRPADGR